MEDKVLARVAEREIKESDLQTIMARYPQERRGQFESGDGRKAIIEQMIAFELINKFGKEINIDSTNEYKENVKQAEKDILTQLTINKILSDITLTDEDALKYYNSNKEKFTEQPKVSAKHILVESKELCDKIKNEIDSNEITFEEAAAKYSTCPSKDQEGNLGTFGKEMMVPEFEVVAFALDLNVVSESVKTQFGYHLIKVEDKVEGRELPFEEVKAQIVNNLMQELQQRKYLDVVTELEKKYGVIRE